MITATNVPYVKQYEMQTVDGIKMPVLTNPITKDNPYLNDGSNRKNRKPNRGRAVHNGNRDSIVVHQMLLPDENGELKVMTGKYRKRKQYINKLVRIPTKNGSKIIKKYVGKMVVHNDLLTQPKKKEK